MERRSEENELRRRRLIAAAQQVAARDGLAGLTLQAVAAEADVALRTVYNHFESREDLVGAAMATLAYEVRDVAAAIDFSGADGRDQMRRFIEEYTKAYLAQGDGLTALMNAVDLPQIADVIQEVRGWRRRRIRDIVKEAERDGTLAIPAKEAVEIAYLATAHATLKSLTTDAGLKPSAAQALLATMVDRALFTS